MNMKQINDEFDFEYEKYKNCKQAQLGPWDTTDMAHRPNGLNINEIPEDLLRQSEREGWRYAKECEAEVKRLTDLNRQLVAAAKELGAADDVHEWDDAWAKMAKLMRQGEINVT